MNKINKIAGINLAILATYFLLLKVSSKKNDYLGTMLFMAFAIAAQATINAILSLTYFFSKRSDLGKAYLLSMGLVLIIGFSACVGGASI